MSLEDSAAEHSAPGLPEPANGQPALLLSPEDHPKLDHLITEDNKPVDSLFVEWQYRLLTEPLYSSWPGPGEGRPFMATVNVGLFYQPKNPAFVPDAMLSLDVRWPWDPEQPPLAKVNRSYYVWLVGKPPDVVIEIVSDRTGGEAGHKMTAYHGMGIPYYVIFDPNRLLSDEVLRTFAIRDTGYEPLEKAWFPKVGLGLCLWEGIFQGARGQWLRWCGEDGSLIATADEKSEQEKKRTDRLEAKLRALGVDPSS